MPVKVPRLVAARSWIEDDAGRPARSVGKPPRNLKAQSSTLHAAAPAAAAKWTYKAIFRVGDQRVGQWSDAVSINVAA